MSNSFEIHSLSNLTEEELWEYVDELKSMVENEIDYRNKEKEFIIEGEMTNRSFYVKIKASTPEEAEKIFWKDVSMYSEPTNVRWLKGSYNITDICSSIGSKILDETK